MIEINDVSLGTFGVFSGWREYRLNARGSTLRELLDSAVVRYIDRDGIETDVNSVLSIGLPTRVRDAALDMIEDYIKAPMHDALHDIAYSEDRALASVQDAARQAVKYAGIQKIQKQTD